MSESTASKLRQISVAHKQKCIRAGVESVIDRAMEVAEIQSTLTVTLTASESRYAKEIIDILKGPAHGFKVGVQHNTQIDRTTITVSWDE